MNLLILVCLVALAAAAPSPKIASAPNDVQLLRYENNNDGIGNFNYKFEQSDGTKQQQRGEVKNAGTENQSIVIKGYYSWVAPDGVIYIVNYVADENGFQPEIESGTGEEGPGSGVSPGLLGSLLG